MIYKQYSSFSFASKLLLVGSILFSSSCISTKESNPSNTSTSARRTRSSNTSELSDKKRVQFEHLFFDANKEKILGNYERALHLYFSSLKVNPNSAAAMYEMASIYALQNNMQYTSYYSKRAAAIEPNNIWMQLLYGECLQERGQWKEALKVYLALIEKHPAKSELYYDLVRIYLQLNNVTEAIKTYKTIENNFGFNKELAMQQIQLLQAAEKTDDAIIIANKLIEKYPDNYKYYGVLGELYQNNGETEKAFEVYQGMLKQFPENPYVHLTLADYYRVRKEKEQWFTETVIAFESKELDIDTKVKILLSYYSITEQSDELKPDADSLCRIMTRVNDDDAKSFSIYGDFLVRDQKLEEARAAYRKAIDLDKERYALWNQLLLLDSELMDYESLLKDSKETMELFPNQALPYFLSGVANIQLKKYRDAIVILNYGKDFVIENELLLSQFYAYIGDSHNELKEFKASDKAYEIALSKDPNNAGVLNNYSYYLSLRKEQLDKAAIMSKKSNELQPNNASFQDTYGWVLYQMGEYDDALIWIGKAINNVQKDNGTLLEHYGDILFKQKKKDEALNYWKKARNAGGASDLLDKKISGEKLYE